MDPLRTSSDRVPPIVWKFWNSGNSCISSSCTTPMVIRLPPHPVLTRRVPLLNVGSLERSQVDIPGAISIVAWLRQATSINHFSRCLQQSSSGNNRNDQAGSNWLISGRVCNVCRFMFSMYARTCKTKLHKSPSCAHQFSRLPHAITTHTPSMVI